MSHFPLPFHENDPEKPGKIAEKPQTGEGSSQPSAVPGEGQETEFRFQSLVEQAPFSIQIFDPTGKTIRVNHAWEKLWGMRFAEVSAYNVLGDSQLEAKGLMPFIRRGFAGETVRLPAIYYDPNELFPDRPAIADRGRWVSGVIYPLKDAAGEIREVVIVHEDITVAQKANDALRQAQRELEAKVALRTAELARNNEFLKALLENVEDGIVACDAAGVLTLFNGVTRRFHGVDEESIPTEQWAERYQLYRSDGVMMRTDEIPLYRALNGEPVRNVEMTIHAVGQPPRTLLASGTAFYDAHGAKLGAVVSMHDVTARKQAEAALREAHHELERRVEDRTQQLAQANEALRISDRRKDEFLATLAHELRNPLAPIRNAIQILKLPGLEQVDSDRAWDIMERQVHVLIRLVDDLLDVSRVMRGKVELRRESVELATIIARAVESAQPLMDAQGHQLLIELPPESLLIHADPVRMAQVIGNLLTNAAKYTEREGTIEVTARRVANQVVLKVRDNGIGIARDMLRTIFDLFTQVDHATTKSQGGLGIGLTLVKSLVELHGGSVEAFSQGLAQGSEFVVRLPLVPAPPKSATPLRVEAKIPANRLEEKKLMVVDDNHDSANSLAMLLRLQGHEVRVAHDGRAAIEVAMQFHPAAIFLDLGMPELDGYEVARRLRATPGLEGLCLIALTGWGQNEDRRKSAAAGFNWHLVKPADFKALREIIAEIHA